MESTVVFDRLGHEKFESGMDVSDRLRNIQSEMKTEALYGGRDWGGVGQIGAKVQLGLAINFLPGWCAEIVIEDDVDAFQIWNTLLDELNVASEVASLSIDVGDASWVLLDQVFEVLDFAAKTN